MHVRKYVDLGRHKPREETPLKIVLNFALAAVAAVVALPAFGTLALAQKNACMDCHPVDLKYAGQTEASAKVTESSRKGGTGKREQIAMPAQPALSEADAKTLADWVLNGAK